MPVSPVDVGVLVGVPVTVPRVLWKMMSTWDPGPPAATLKVAVLPVSPTKSDAGTERAPDSVVPVAANSVTLIVPGVRGMSGPQTGCVAPATRVMERWPSKDGLVKLKVPVSPPSVSLQI